MPSGGWRRWTPPGCCRALAGWRCMTAGRRTGATPPPRMRCARRILSGSSRGSARSRGRAGPRSLASGSRSPAARPPPPAPPAPSGWRRRWRRGCGSATTASWQPAGGGPDARRRRACLGGWRATATRSCGSLPTCGSHRPRIGLHTAPPCHGGSGPGCGCSVGELAALQLDRGVRPRRVVEVLVLVVAGLAGEEAGVEPFADGAGRDAELCGKLDGGEHASGAEALVAGCEAVGSPDAGDGDGVEGPAVAGGESLVVEDAGDVAFGVRVEELVDPGDGGGGCASGFPGAQRHRQREAVELPAPEPCVNGDRVVAYQGDVLDEEAGHPFAFSLGGGGVGP